MLEGYVHPDFSDVARVLRRQLPGSRRRFEPGGAAVCIFHRGELVVDCWGGTRDAEGDPWEEDTIAISFSTTKGVASTLLHILVDRGLVDYEAPVREYWPEFGEGGKEELTVRQVLAHEAGLYAIRPLIDHASEMLDWERMTRALAVAEPRHRPGASHGYHAFTYGWLVGEIIQRVTGRRFSEVLEEEVAKPLELDGLYVGVPREQMHRRAQLIQRRRRRRSTDSIEQAGEQLARRIRFARLRFDPVEAVAALMPQGVEEIDFGSETFAAASIPAANGHFTARSLAKLYAVLAAGGELGGVRLLSEETVARAGEVQNRGVGRVVPYPMHWRLGYHRVNTIRGRAPRGFGHSGFGGSGAWADPERELAVALVLNSGTGTPFGDLRIIQISGAALRCADRR
ncbi:MAG: serine hydrolase domain-containing protein [Myxococcota bacterium]